MRHLFLLFKSVERFGRVFHFISISCSVLYVIPSSTLHSQQLYFKYYTINEGFPHAQVWDIFQDRQGYVWFATAGGVAKYNGIEFTVYTKDDGMVSNVIRSIFQDDDGKLWLCTDDGVAVFDGKSFVNYTTKDGLAPGAVFEMVKDRTGNYWFVTSYGGISRFDGKNFHTFSKKDGLSGEYRNAFKDKEGNLWFSGKNRLWLLPYDGQNYADSFTDFRVEDIQNLSDIEEDPQGRIIVGSNRGMVVFDYAGFKRQNITDYKKFLFEINPDGDLPTLNTHEIAVGPDSSIWLATDDGIFKWQNENYTGYLADENISTNSCHSLLVDLEGTVWVGTDGGGCFKLPYQNIFNFTIRDGLSANVANAVTGDKAGNIFVGTDNGVDKYDGQKFTPISRDVIGLGNTVWALMLDSRGALWIGTDRNLTEFKNGKASNRTDIYNAAGSSVLDIAEDQNRTLWFGTLNGLIVYDGKRTCFYDTKNGLPGNQVWCVFTDKEDRIWLGINGGLVKVEDKTRLDSLKFKVWTTAEGLQDNTVNVVTQDTSGTYWIGTDLGFAKFDGVTFSNYKPKNLGLADNIVPVIQYDSNSGQLWVGSKGFGRFDVDTSPPAMKKLLNKERGLRVDDPTTNNSFFIDSNRIVWIAHFGGLTRYYEDSLKHVAAPPKIFIERVVTSDTILRFHYLSNDENKTVPDLESKYVVFQFAGLSYLNEKDNSYQYMLEGFDKDWSAVSKKTEVRYTNLSPGQYSFKVKMHNSENTESEQPAIIVFNVPAPLWQNPFMILLFLTLVGYGAYKGYRIRVNLKLERIRKRNEFLESEVQKRTAEIVHQKEELESILEKLKQTQTQLVQSEKMAALGQLVAGVAHEINNPTSVLAGNVVYVEDYVNVLRKIIDRYENQYVDNLEFLRELSEFKKQIDYDFVTSDLDTLLNSIKNAAERIRHIVLDLRNFSRLDEVELNEVDINESIDTTVKLFMNQFKHVLKIDKDYRATNIIYCYVNQINQVILNILINAAQAIETKFAGHSSAEIPGRINIVTTNVEKGGVTVKIRDNGLGIAKQVQSRVFDPFYTTKPVGQGTGLGLSISYSIIEKHHGNIAYESAEGEWTEFTFTLPFKPHEIPS